MMCHENSISPLQKFAVMLTTFLSEYNDIINAYVLDYFVENSWQKLPVSWQNVLEKLEPQEIGQFLDSSQSLRLKEVWPLSLQAFRSSAFSLAVTRRPICSSNPVELFMQEIKLERNVNSESFSWKTPSLEFKNKSGQHQSLPEMCRKHVKPKKQHEIFRLAQLTNHVLKKFEINHVVDIGSGLGHLSRVLCFQYNLKVATIEAVSSHTSAAGNFDKQILQQAWPKDVIDSKIISPFSLLGLHTCGDLAATLMKLFVETAQAYVLLSVGCCYMKLNEKLDYKGYPLSTYVKKLRHSGLSYEARELCCHALEGYIQRLKENGASLKIHCYRAVLEKIIITHHPDARHIGLKGVKNAENMKFYEYAVKALSKCSLNIPCEALLSPVNESHLNEWKKVVVLYSLRLLIAPVIETLILLDRMIYLYENGCYSCILPVFDPMLSPRNHVLLGVKKQF